MLIPVNTFIQVISKFIVNKLLPKLLKEFPNTPNESLMGISEENIELMTRPLIMKKLEKAKVLGIFDGISIDLDKAKDYVYNLFKLMPTYTIPVFDKKITITRQDAEDFFKYFDDKEYNSDNVISLGYSKE